MNSAWDYRTLHHTDLAKGLVAASEAGADGWELVTVLDPRETVGYAFVLKQSAVTPSDAA